MKSAILVLTKARSRWQADMISEALTSSEMICLSRPPYTSVRRVFCGAKTRSRIGY